jgi:hypothetical protein
MFHDRRVFEDLIALQSQDPIDVIAGLESVTPAPVGNGGEPSGWSFDPGGSVEIAWRLAH